MIIKLQIFFICLFAYLSSCAQVNLQLKGKNDKLRNDLIRTIKVDTRFLKSNKSFGRVYADNKKMIDVSLENGISNAFKKHLNTYESNSKAPELVLKIEIFDINEKLLAGNLIEGKIWLETAAFLVLDGDTNSLCRARSNVKYQRSHNVKVGDNLGNEVRICLDNCYFYILNYIIKNKGILENYAESSEVIIKPYKTKVASDTVYYQQRKVSWSDFKGPVRSQSDYGAAIFASFGYESKLYTEFGQIRMEITPKIFMDKNMSWSRSEMRNAYGLAHEQLHFDIAYLLSLQFLKKIKTFKAKTEKDLLSLVNYEYLEFYKKMHTVQELYDAETEHSLNRDFQGKWDKKTKSDIATFDINALYK